MFSLPMPQSGSPILAPNKQTKLNSRSTVPEKLTIPEQVKKFLDFYGTRRFITAFTTASHFNKSWAR